MNPRIVSGKEFAALCGKSKSWVAGLAKEMPGVTRVTGKRDAQLQINLAEALPWLLDRNRPRDAESESQRARLYREQADRLALDNAVRRGELCTKADTRSVVIGAVIAHRNERNGIASRLASELADLTSPAEIRARILDELRDVDERFAKGVGAFGGEDDSSGAQEAHD